MKNEIWFGVVNFWKGNQITIKKLLLIILVIDYISEFTDVVTGA